MAVIGCEMSDDPSVSQNVRRQPEPEPEPNYAIFNDTDIVIGDGSSAPTMQVYQPPQGVTINRPDIQSSPFAMGNHCPGRPPGESHRTSLPLGEGVVKFAFGDNGTIQLYPCMDCSGLYWERDR